MEKLAMKRNSFRAYLFTKLIAFVLQRIIKNLEIELCYF